MWGAANADLKPENMLNYEVAVGQSFLDGRLYGEVTAFFIDGKNMIESVRVNPASQFPQENRNVGTFTNKGIELEGRYQILRNLSMDMNYSYLHTSKPLLAAPAHKLNVGATYSPGRFTFNANVQSVYDLYVRLENPANKISEVKENYTVLNARAAYRFGSRDKGLNLFVKGENLTATRYTINYGFPMPKAVFMGGIDVTF